jgi:hypothetical protein
MSRIAIIQGYPERKRRPEAVRVLGAKASDPEVDLHFWDRSDALSFIESIVEFGKPDPPFRTIL